LTHRSCNFFKVDDFIFNFLIRLQKSDGWRQISLYVKKLSQDCIPEFAAL
jgi:hypothetical protein